jgi:cell wall assembly regulator SMI1
VVIPVEKSWRRIVTWLAEYAPVTAAAIRPSAGAAEVRRTEEAVGRPLPADVLAWWELMDGIDDADYRAGFPIATVFMPLPVVRVRERSASLSRFADQSCCGVDGSHVTTAGERLFGFCTATAPICWDLGGDVLVVDLRDGAHHGCVMEWTAEEGYFETAWAGTATMLADIADRLDDPTWTQVVDGGVLQRARSR